MHSPRRVIQAGSPLLPTLRKKQLMFDPRKLSPQDAVRRLAKREGRWGEVWGRFAASTGFETVVTYLCLEEPGTLFEHWENRGLISTAERTGREEAA